MLRNIRVKDSYEFDIKYHDSLVVELTFDCFVAGIVVTLRGRVQVQWKVVKNGAVYTVRNCQFLLDQKHTIWGQGWLL